MSRKYFPEDLTHGEASAIPGSSEEHMCSSEPNAITTLNYLSIMEKWALEVFPDDPALSC